MKYNILEQLASIANALDDIGMTKYASDVDVIFVKLAQTQLELWKKFNPGGDWPKKKFEKEYVTRVKDVPFEREEYIPEIEDEDYGKLYHTTIDWPSLSQQGFKSRRETGRVGLGGGGSESERLSSVTYSPNAAYQIAEQLRESVPIARGQLNVDKVLDLLSQRIYPYFGDEYFYDLLHRYLKSIGVEEARNIDLDFESNAYEKLEELARRNIKTPDDLWNLYIGMLDLAGRELSDDVEFRPLMDMIIVTPREQIAQIDVSKIKTIPAALRRGALAKHYPGEEELRVNPKDLWIGDWEFIKKHPRG